MWVAVGLTLFRGQIDLCVMNTQGNKPHVFNAYRTVPPDLTAIGRFFLCSNSILREGQFIMAKTKQEKIEDIQAEIKQLENQRKQLLFFASYSKSSIT